MPNVKINLKMTKSQTFEVLLDNQLIGYVSNGEIKEYKVTEGQHKLKIKGSWTESKNLYFSILSNEIKNFTVSRSKILYYVAVIILLFLASPLFITNNIYLWLFPVIVPAFLILVLLIFFIKIRKSYLILKEGE